MATIFETKKLLKKPNRTKGTQVQVYSCETCEDRSFCFEINSDGFLQGNVCANCSALNTHEPVHTREARCFVLNRLNIAPEAELGSIYTNLTKHGIKAPLLDAAISFVKAWPVYKKKLRKAAILENPDEHVLVRPVEDNQVTALHMLTRNSIFQIVGDKERRTKYSDKSVLTDELIDKTIRREFVGWGGQIHFLVSGPILCTFDQQVFYACLCIHHERGFRGLKLETSITEICRAMGKSCSIGTSSLNAIKRSLSRLANVSIKAAPMVEPKGNFWAGGIVDEVSYYEAPNSKFSKVIIRLNTSMVPQYLSGSYSTLYLPHLNTLRAYASRIYEFLMSHDDPERRMGLDKWRNVLGVAAEIPDKTFKQRLKEALGELITKDILAPESGFVGPKSKQLLVTQLKRSKVSAEKSL